MSTRQLVITIEDPAGMDWPALYDEIAAALEDVMKLSLVWKWDLSWKYR